ncbi:MAG: CBS domain-containing protein [Gemmatimonadaceae bacterium]
MLRLHDIMTRDLVTLSPEHTLREAMSILTSKHISGAPVVSGQNVVGVVSLTDLADLASSAPGVPTEHPEQAEWGEFDEPVDLPEGEEPPSSYFQRLWDDAGAEVGERMAAPEGPEWDALQEHTVGEAMTRDIQWLVPERSVEEAAQFMRNASIHRVLVIEDGKLLGMVTTKDIADAVADHKLSTRTYVFGAPSHL